MSVVHFLLVIDHPFVGDGPSMGFWVTIHCSCHLVFGLCVKSKRHILCLQYTSFWWVTTLGSVGDHPRDER